MGADDQHRSRPEGDGPPDPLGGGTPTAATLWSVHAAGERLLPEAAVLLTGLAAHAATLQGQLCSVTAAAGSPPALVELGEIWVGLPAYLSDAGAAVAAVGETLTEFVEGRLAADDRAREQYERLLASLPLDRSLDPWAALPQEADGPGSTADPLPVTSPDPSPVTSLVSTRPSRRDALSRLLDAIETDLADLAHVDRVLDARDAFHADPDAGDVAAADDVGELSGWDIPAGRRFPFEITVHGLAPASGARWVRRSAELRRETALWARRRVDAVRAASAVVVEPDTASLLGAGEATERAARVLDEVLPHVRDVEASGGVVGGGEPASGGAAGPALRNLAWLLRAVRAVLLQAATAVELGQVGLRHALAAIRRGLLRQLEDRADDERGAPKAIEVRPVPGAGDPVLAHPVPPLPGPAPDPTPQAAQLDDEPRLREPDWPALTAQRADEYAACLDDVVRAVLAGADARWSRVHSLGAATIRQRAADLERIHGRTAFHVDAR